MIEEYISKIKQNLPSRNTAWLNAAFAVAVFIIITLFILPRITLFIMQETPAVISPDTPAPELFLTLFTPTLATLFFILPTIILIDYKENLFAKLNVNHWHQLQIPIAVIAAFFAFTLCAIITSIITMIMNLLGISPEIPTLIELAKKCSGINFILIIIAVVVAAPLTEELIFRRIIFGFLATRIGLVASIIVTSALFALVHDSPTQFAALFVLGMGFQVIALAFNSLIPAIIMHSCFNSITMGILIVIRYGNLPIQ